MKTILLFAMLFCGSILYGQVSNMQTYKSLKVGDTIPINIEFKTFNYAASTVNNRRFSDFKGHPLIIDIWSTNCTSCIESFPHLESLQNQFHDKLQIILANWTDSLPKIIKLLDRRKRVIQKSLSLETIYENQLVWRQLFYYSSVPHIIWVDKSGVVASITNEWDLNEKNIQMFLSEVTPKMRQKTDFKLEVDYKAPLFIRENAGNGEGLIWYSVLSKYIEGAGSSFSFLNDKNNGLTMLIRNMPTREIYRIAFGHHGTFWNPEAPVTWSPMPLNRTLLDVKDTTKYVAFIEDQLNLENCYTFQLITPLSSINKFNSVMLQDLNNYFHIEAKLEKRKVMCFVLSAEDTSIVSYKSGKRSFYIDEFHHKLNNVELSVFLDWLEGQPYYTHAGYPIVDETKIKGKIGDVEIEGNIQDPVFLNKVLSKYKMHFKLEEREVNILVIREN